MLTTEAFVAALVDALVAQGVTVDDAAALKTTLKASFDAWLDAPDALPANIAQKLASTAGYFNAEVLSRYDWWTVPADGGPNGDGTINLTLADGTVVPVPGRLKLVDATEKGNAGWSPILVTVADGPTRVVLQVTDWTGGEGTKPATGVYLGAAGFVSDIAEAVDVFAAVTGYLEDQVSAAATAEEGALAAKAEAEEAAQEYRQSGIRASPERTHSAGAWPNPIAWGLEGDAGNLAFGVDSLMTALAHALHLAGGGDGLRLGGDSQITAAPSTRWPIRIVGDDGKLVAGMRETLAWMFHGLEVAGLAQLLEGASLPLGKAVALGPEAQLIARTTNWPFAFIGDEQRVMFGLDKGGRTHVDKLSVRGVDINDLAGAAVAELMQLDAQNLARSASVMGRSHNVAVATPAGASWNLVLGYGQSLMAGNQSWPALSLTGHPKAFSIGTSVRPQRHNNAAWEPITDGALHALTATVESIAEPRTSLTPLEVAALDPSEQNQGETPLVSLTNEMARAWDEYVQEPDRKWVAVNAAVGGRTVAELSKGATPELYNRNLDAKALFDGLATTAGASHQVLAVPYMQGEADYADGTAEATYKAALSALFDDLVADFAQTPQPAFFIYQTGATYSNDSQELAVGMAQWELSRERRDLWMVGPHYQVTDVGGHLSANGSVWFGLMLAKVMRHVLFRRLDWEPLAPLWVRQVGEKIQIGFHVPAPPLRWGLPYLINTATDFATKGFRVTDSVGAVGITDVQIIGATIVEITCDRAADPGTGRVWYASKTTHNGNGNLFDSDETLATEVYRYVADSGMDAGADIAALNDNPYPLQNACVAFCLPLSWSR